MGAPFVFAAQFFPTGAPPGSPPGLPMVHVSVPGAIILVDGVTGALPIVLPGSGFFMSFSVPQGFAGQSVLFQAAAFSASAANGSFATTDGHEIRIVS